MGNCHPLVLSIFISYLDNEMGDEVLFPPFFLSSIAMAQRLFTYVSSHINVMRPKVISKKM